MVAQRVFLRKNLQVTGNVPGTVLGSELRTGPHGGNDHTYLTIFIWELFFSFFSALSLGQEPTPPDISQETGAE